MGFRNKHCVGENRDVCTTYSRRKATKVFNKHATRWSPGINANNRLFLITDHQAGELYQRTRGVELLVSCRHLNYKASVIQLLSGK